MKIENPIVFYPKRAADFLWKGARWLRIIWTVRSIARKIEADPAKRDYMDASLTPVVDDREAFDELEMIHTHAASANKLQRAQIHVHEHTGSAPVPLIAAE